MKHFRIFLILAAMAMLLYACGHRLQSRKFDGHVLYADAFEQLMDHHILLRDGNSKFVRDWASTWEHKHDSDHALDTEDGADKAVFEMMGSLGQRFDYYILPTQTKRERAKIDPSFVGIGVSIVPTGADAYIKAEAAKLPKNATRADKQVAERHIEEGLSLLKLGPDNALEIVQPLPGSAAEAAGIKAGDRILAVDGVSVSGLTVDMVTANLHGAEGSAVAVTVERKDTNGKFAPQKPMTIVRKAYVTPDVHPKDLGDGVGYVKLDDFVSSFEITEMRDALEKDASGKFVILDLRGNPGGMTDNGIKMAQLFLRDGVILERHQRDGDEVNTRIDQVLPQFFEETTSSSSSPDSIHVDRSDRYRQVLPDDMPLVVLVDENSYSCAEILSGALQFNHRAVVVGQPTGGKGVEQTVVRLVFGRSMHITSAEFMPAGMPHQTDWIGIIPDYIVAQPKADANAQPGTQPVDAQLEAAKRIGWQLVNQRDAHKMQAEALKQKHQDAFKKEREQN